MSTPVSSSTGPISSLATIQDAAAGAGAASTPRNTLGKDDFLRLLTTQLQNQDPLQPVDNQAFIAQLAQFSSLEALNTIGTKLDTLSLAQASTNQLSTASLVGKDVLYRADHVTLAAGTATSFQVSLPSDTKDVTAILADQDGKVVRTFPLGAHPSGSFTVSWDGHDQSGAALPSGQYVLTVSATGSDGQAVEAAGAVHGTVSAVAFEGQTPELVIQGQHVKLSDVLQIGTTTAG